MSELIHPLGELARRFTVDWLDRADDTVPTQLMSADYRIHIGTAHLDGRDAYVTGTMGQLALFPGLLLTVHELVTDGEQLALVFTEHGASARHEGRPAAWRGVALFRCDDGRLAENWTQEDYWSRRRQLADGAPDQIPAPAPAPWTTPPAPPDPVAEQAARAWLAAPDVAGVAVDEGEAGDGTPMCVDVTSVDVHRLFSAGPRVAFAATWTGTWRGGPGDAPGDGRTVELGTCGVLHLEAGRVIGGQVVTDRRGLAHALP